jgi:hypothetical protein
VTPWDYLTASAPDPAVQVLALAQVLQGPLDDGQLVPSVAQVPPGQMMFLGPAQVDTTGTLVTRQVQATFGPLPIGTPPAEIWGFALVDPSASQNVLATVQLLAMQQLLAGGPTLVISGLMVIAT